MTLIRARALSFLNEKIELEEVHYVATFLVPQLRFLTQLSKQEKKETHAAIRSMMDKIESK